MSTPIERIASSLEAKRQLREARDRHRQERGFSPRLLSSKKQKQWIDEHCPYPKGTYLYFGWCSEFYFDQGDAVWDPRRSRAAWVQQRVLLPAQVILGVYAVVILVMVISRAVSN